MIIFVVLMVASFIIQKMLTSRMEKYSNVPLSSGLSGKQVAEKMLRDNGIHDVQVTCTSGYLTDHYDPTKKTVNLSEGVFEGRSIASAAVAAHECGHAVQHATAYRWLTLRSKLVPATQLGTQLSQWVLLIGIVLLNIQRLAHLGYWVLLIGILFFAITTLFAIITLPVEYNASARAVEWLDSHAITTGEETAMAKDGLKWAARTYLIAAISSLATLLYYIMIFLGRRD